MRLQILFGFFICAICFFVTSAKDESDEVSNKITEISIAIEELNKKSDKISKVVENLYEILAKRDQCDISAIKKDIINEITLQFKSICQSNLDNGNISSSSIKEINSTKNSGVCDPNPCLNGGHCEVKSTGSEYLCTRCPSLTTGKNCEELNCGGNKCFQLNNTVYVVYEKKGSWNDANNTCASEGMSLAMLKDEESDVFVRDQLKSLYKINGKMIFWFGLKGSSNGPSWVDGSPLGSYTGGKELFELSLNEGCASLIGRDGMFNWYPDNCAYFPAFEQYPLCEKQL